MWGSASDVGMVRRNNQDSFLVASPLFVVADGMGGHAGGEVASQTAVEAMERSFPPAQATPDDLVDAVRWANRAVWRKAEEEAELRGMGTTVTAVALIEDAGHERLLVANVGDSRTYLLRDRSLTQVTLDHSVVEELVRLGQITEEEAAIHPQRHVLTRVLGMGPDVEVDVFPVDPFYTGDRFVLCSDGLFNEVTEEAIAATLNRFPDPQEAARDLVAQAKANGGNDNITVVVIDVVEDDDASRKASAALALESSVARKAPTLEVEVSGGPDGKPPARRGPPPPVDAPSAARVSAPAVAPAAPPAPEPPPPTGAPADPPVPRPGPRAPSPGGSPGGDTGRVGGAGAHAGTFRAPVRRRDVNAASGSSAGRVGLNLKVIGFVALLVLVLGVTLTAVSAKANGSFFVRFDAKAKDELFLFKGQPGGTLWINPKRQDPPLALRAELPASSIVDLEKGHVFTSSTAARNFVLGLKKQKKDAEVQAAAQGTGGAAGDNTPAPTTLPPFPVPSISLPPGDGT